MSAADPDPRDVEEINRHLPEGHKVHVKKPKPPPTPPPPPKPKPSWLLNNGPWIFVESDPGTCPAGPWTRLDIIPNHICEGAPLWCCDNGKVPQAEGQNESDAAVGWVDDNYPAPRTMSVAPVTTLGINVQAWKAIGVTSVFVECYLQSGEQQLAAQWQAGVDGWGDVIPVVGVGFGDTPIPLSAYLPTYHDDKGDLLWPGLAAYGKRFGVYASDPMSADDWQTLRGLVS